MVKGILNTKTLLCPWKMLIWPFICSSTQKNAVILTSAMDYLTVLFVDHIRGWKEKICFYFSIDLSYCRKTFNYYDFLIRNIDVRYTVYACKCFKTRSTCVSVCVHVCECVCVSECMYICVLVWHLLACLSVHIKVMLSQVYFVLFGGKEWPD